MFIFNKLFSILAILLIGFTLVSTSLPTYAIGFLPSSSDICGDEGSDNACNAIGGGSTVKGATGVTNIIIQVARTITYIAGALAVLLLVYGGIRYLTASDEKTVGTARLIIQNAIIGLVIAILAFAIITIVINLLSGQFIGDA